MCLYGRPLITCFAIVLLGFMPTVLTFVLLHFFPTVISSESISAVVLIDFACACWSFIVGDKKRQSLWPRRPAPPVDQGIESAADEDKPPEYEKVVAIAPPYESVLLEDAYKNRATINVRNQIRVTHLNECTKKGATSHELDPDLPTYEEASSLLKPKD